MMHFRARLPLAASAALFAFSLAVPATAEQNLNVLDFETTVGSFKLLGSENPAHGKLEFSFTGTVLVSGLSKGTVTVTGNVRKEYDNAAHMKQVYHGTGKMVVDGDFMAVQFFGQNLVAKFAGVGIFRLYGEFDKNLNTGQWWYEGGEKHDWGTGGAQLTVPGYKPGAHPNQMPAGPTVKIKPTPKG